MRTRVALSGALVPASALAAAAVVALGAAASADHIKGFETGAAVVTAACVVLVAALARPAWTLSIGLALGVFNSHWPDIGLSFSMDRVIIGVGIASTLVRAVRARGWSALRTTPVHWLIAVTALYAATSAILAGTLDDSVARYALIDRFGLLPFLVFFIAPLAFPEPRDRQVLLGVLVGLGAYLGITALLETTGPDSLVVPGYITDPNVGIHFDRARGPFTEAVANGMAMFGCGVAAVIAVTQWRGRWRLVAGGVAVLCVLGELFTLTRAVWLSAGIAAVAALLATPQTRRVIVPASIVGLLLVVGAFAAIPGLQGKADERSNDQQPIWDRKNSDAAALRMIDARPLLGFGWGRFALDSDSYYRQSPDYPLTGVREAHNVYLSDAVELGLIGALVWFTALLLGVGGAIFKRGPPDLIPWKLGLVAVLVEWLVVATTTPLAFAMPIMLMWMWAGMCRVPPQEDPTMPSAS
jgi:O-antigen ligase